LRYTGVAPTIALIININLRVKRRRRHSTWGGAYTILAYKAWTYVWVD
jgi:hypothetical protein